MSLNKKILKDSIVVGLALFSMFFGAGSLIFPPYLGMTSGQLWLQGFLSFVITDVGLAFLAIFAMTRLDGDVKKVVGRIGRVPGLVVATLMILCIGPFFAVPRTGATAFEMAVKPFAGEGSMLVFSIFYFAVSFLLTIRPTKVVSIVGAILTPLLLVMLAALIVKGVVDPIAPLSETPQQGNVIANGIIAGYQTLDVFASLSFSIIIINAVNARGFSGDHKAISKVVGIASLIAGGALFLVFGGLAYLGATVSTLYGTDTSQAEIIMIISTRLLGGAGSGALGVIVALACLTTAIGVTSSCAAFFVEVSNGKIPYRLSVTAISAFSLAVSNFGLQAIIGLAVPLLTVLYPIVLVVIFSSIFQKLIPRDSAIKGAAIGAGVVSILTVLASYGVTFFPIEEMPLFETGLNWLIPALAAGAVGWFLPQRKTPGSGQPQI